VEILRATNVSVIPFIREHLLPDEDISVETYEANIRSALVSRPESVFLLVGFENQHLHGFLLAYAPDNMKYSFISQAWCDEFASHTKLADQFFIRLLRWTDAIGREGIRAETFRDIRGFTRKWGFKPISTTMQLNLDDVNQDAIFARLQRQEQNNVEEGRSQTNLNVEQESESDQHTVGQLSVGKDRTGGDSIRGSTDSSADATVRADHATAAELAPSDLAEHASFTDSLIRQTELAPKPGPSNDSTVLQSGGGDSTTKAV
jgi:hypothetical protein